MEEIKLKPGQIYRTLSGDLIKIISINKEQDLLHIYNMSDKANQWIGLKQSYKYKFKSLEVDV